MKTFKRFVSLTVAGMTVSSLYASEPSSVPLFVRPLGMGGAFTAVADDYNIFSFNPAGMVQRTGAEVTILEIAPGVSEDTMEAYDFIKDNENDLTDFDTLPVNRQIQLITEIRNDISKLNPRVYVAGNVASFVSGPRFLGMPVHVGFGALFVADLRFKLNTSLLVPNISYEVNNDFLIPVSVAHRWNAPFRIPGRISFGATGKLLRRMNVSQERVSVAQLDDLDVPPLSEGHAVGLDLGTLYQPTDRTNIGMMVRDAFGTKIKFKKIDAEEGYPEVAERESVIKPETNIGAAFVPEKFLWLIPTNDRWTFSADIQDILKDDEHVLFERGFRKPFGENLPTHTRLGAEFRYWFLRFRGGAYQGYPTFGLGLDIPFLKLDYAYYSRELGALAGDLRQGNHIVSLALRFGSGHTEARERISKSKEARRGGRSDGTPESVTPEAVVEPAAVVPAEQTATPEEEAKPVKKGKKGKAPKAAEPAPAENAEAIPQ